MKKEADDICWRLAKKHVMMYNREVERNKKIREVF